MFTLPATFTPGPIVAYAPIAVMPDECAAADHSVFTYRRARTDHDARCDDGSHADRAARGDVCARVNERCSLPAGGRQTADDLAARTIRRFPIAAVPTGSVSSQVTGRPWIV